DPTVNALEERAAELLGKEAGLFVASGSMGNLVSQVAHLSRGQETIAGGNSHMVVHEAAGHAVIVGTSVRQLPERPDGTLDLAVVAHGVDPQALAGPADSVSFCLSKGLSCPVGSVVVGTREFIWRARRGRKLVGGGMRQAGVLAAPGLLALRDGALGMIERLAEDHANARRLAEGLADLDGIESAGGIAQPAPGRLDP